jgi:hypothetical protein
MVGGLVWMDDLSRRKDYVMRVCCVVGCGGKVKIEDCVLVAPTFGGKAKYSDPNSNTANLSGVISHFPFRCIFFGSLYFLTLTTARPKYSDPIQRLIHVWNRPYMKQEPTPPLFIYLLNIDTFNVRALLLALAGFCSISYLVPVAEKLNSIFDIQYSIPNHQQSLFF